MYMIVTHNESSSAEKRIRLITKHVVLYTLEQRSYDYHALLQCIATQNAHLIDYTIYYDLLATHVKTVISHIETLVVDNK